MSKTPQFIIGRQIGEGCYKKCYDLPDDPTRVLLVSQTSDLEREWRELLMLNELGIPTVLPDCIYNKVKFKTAAAANWTTSRGMLMERMAGSSRGDGAGRVAMDVLNDKTAEDLRRLRAALRTGAVYIQDLQFLFGRDGSLKVSDPLAVVVLDESNREHYDREWWASDLMKIEKGIVYAKYLRKNNLKINDSANYFWSDARSHWEKHEEPNLAAEAAKQGIPTAYFELRRVA